MRLVAAFVFSFVSPVLAEEFSLKLPIDCPLGEDRRCYIQDYMDRDISAGHTDYTCRGITRDGHKGTDFALRSEAEIARNVAVRAAADGIVQGARNTVPDKRYTRADHSNVAGKECGNGMVIAHGAEWETQYCHLRLGSVAVSPGEKVRAGDLLGYVGMSGLASFPHLHFSVRQSGVPIDPFDAGSVDDACNIAPTPSLWETPISYSSGGLISAGFSADLPNFDDIKKGTAAAQSMPITSPAFLIWGSAYHGRPDDILRMTITDPNGLRIFATDAVLEKTQPQLFRAGGRRTLNADWFIPGTYTGTVEMIRDGDVISDTTVTTTVTR